MSALRTLQRSAPKFSDRFHGRPLRKGQTYKGLPGEGGDWKAHWTKQSLKRSESYRQSVHILDQQCAEEIRRHNWKIDQINLLKSKRATTRPSETVPVHNGDFGAGQCRDVVLQKSAPDVNLR